MPTELRGNTIGEVYGPAMEITDHAAADDYFRQLVAYLMGRDDARTRGEAEAMVRANLGYYAGYYGEETRLRVQRLFGAVHPIFGSIRT